MNILIDEVPYTVKICGLEYEINTDFRIGLMFEELIDDKTLTDNQRVEMAINLYYHNRPLDIQEALDKILWFHRCGKELKPKKDGLLERDSVKQKNIFSYDEDAHYIYSAFLQQYRIDLQDVSNLHWWKFRAMFNSLMECKFTEIIGYRTIKIDSNMTSQQKKFYNDMKRLYALEDNRTEEEKEAAMIDAFSGCF